MIGLIKMNYIIATIYLLIPVFYVSECKVNLKDEDDSDSCEYMLESFAFATGNFTYCAIYYGRPIRLCQLCEDRYTLVRKIYSDINNIDPTGGQYCKDSLFNLDRLQVVDSGFKYVTSLWSKANCDTCYELDDKKEPLHLKPNVQKMLNISDEFDKCVNDHKNDSLDSIFDPLVCKDCLPYYQQINLQYSVLKGTSGEDEICMDIVDLVNRTRFDWATNLGCYVDRKKPEIVYLIITGLVSLIPIAFYFFTWCLITKKQQLVALQNNVPDYLKDIQRRASSAIINTVNR